MDSTFTSRIGEKFMDSLVSNALSGINNNSNSTSNNGPNMNQQQGPRQYGGYQGPPQWYRGKPAGRYTPNQFQGGGDRPPLHDKVDAISEQLKALVQARMLEQQQQPAGLQQAQPPAPAFQMAPQATNPVFQQPFQGTAQSSIPHASMVRMEICTF